MVWYRILPQVLTMSLTGSIVILFVLLARLTLKKAPRIFSYALWGIVLFRLLCPMAPTSQLSLWNLLPDSWQSATLTSVSTSDADSLWDPILSWEADQYFQSQPEYILDPALLTEQFLSNATIDASTGAPLDRPLDFSTDTNPLTDPDTYAIFDLAPSPALRMIHWGTVLWLAGVLTLLGYSFYSLWKLRRQLDQAVPLRDNIYLADHIATPFVLGILRPRIYLPSSLSEDQQAYILLHEQHHVRRLDHVAKLLAFSALCLHWFNPLVWLAFLLSTKDMEMSCDEAVLRRMGDSIRADYSASLLSLATGHRILAGAPLAFGEGNTKDRIHHVLDWKKPRTWIVAVALILCIILAASLMTNPRQPEDFAGYRYKVTGLLYDAPQYSFVLTPDIAPQYTITSDYVLMMRSTTYDTSTWQNIGGLQKVNYSRTELYSLFDPLYCNAHEQLDQVVTIYRAKPFNASDDLFFLVMQTNDGDILLAQGYGEELTGHVRWLFTLEKQSGGYDISKLNHLLTKMHGEGTQYFSLYECDTDPGSLLLGFQKDNSLGCAVFTYDAAEDDYVLQYSQLLPHSVTGLYSMKLTQDDGFADDLQIVMSTRDDLAAIRITSLLASTADFETMKEITSLGQPSMLVFECPDSMTVKNLHIGYVYHWSEEWRFGYVPTPCYGPYRMTAEDSETPVSGVALQLQMDNTFVFTYDMLSSYLNYGHFTVQDNLLTAVTDDGLFQFCFEIVDNQTLKFLTEKSSDVSLIDERLGTPVTDGALFRLEYPHSFES